MNETWNKNHKCCTQNPFVDGFHFVVSIHQTRIQNIRNEKIKSKIVWMNKQQIFGFHLTMCLAQEKIDDKSSSDKK